MSVIGVPMMLAPVFGPVIGGAIISAASWRWIFFINLPVGAAALLTALWLLPDARPQLGQRLDVRGLLLLCPGIAVFLYAMSEASNQGGFGSPRTITATLAGLALIALFLWHATTSGKDALIDVSLLRRRGFATAATLNFLLITALFGSLILIPLYYQVVRHAGPLHVGLLLAPQGIGAALALPLAGWLTDKIGARAVTSAGLVIAMLGMLTFTQVDAQTFTLLPQRGGAGHRDRDRRHGQPLHGRRLPGGFPSRNATGDQRAQRYPAHRRRPRHCPVRDRLAAHDHGAPAPPSRRHHGDRRPLRAGTGAHCGHPRHRVRYNLLGRRRTDRNCAGACAAPATSRTRPAGRQRTGHRTGQSRMTQARRP
jgi:MFS family permease